MEPFRVGAFWMCTIEGVSNVEMFICVYAGKINKVSKQVQLIKMKGD